MYFYSMIIKKTYAAGSNILLSMKHWVAIGGVI